MPRKGPVRAALSRFTFLVGYNMRSVRREASVFSLKASLKSTRKKDPLYFNPKDKKIHPVRKTSKLGLKKPGFSVSYERKKASGSIKPNKDGFASSLGGKGLTLPSQAPMNISYRFHLRIIKKL